MTLTDNQLLMLDILIYSEYCENGKTVEKIIDDIIYALDNPNPNNNDEGINICEMSEEELRSLISKIENQPELLDYTVTNYVYDESTGMRIACFVDDASNPTDVNVIIKGSSGGVEWHDNGEGAYLSDTELQVFAAEYIYNLPEEYGNNITVSGHSKGGNLAQYATIVTDRIARCISFDGQGFSQEFMDKYAEEIAEKADLIVSISAANDIVNALLYPIAGIQIYIETEMQDNLFYFHKPDILLDEDGNLNPITEPSDLSIVVNEFSIEFITTADEPYRSEVIDGLIYWLETGEKEEGFWDGVFAGLDARRELLTYLEEKSGTEARKEAAKIIGISFCYWLISQFVTIGELNSALFNSWLISVVSDLSAKLQKSESSNYSAQTTTNTFWVNTTSLRSCAERLDDIQIRVYWLNQRIHDLYRETGWSDLKEIIDDDDLMNYADRINNCIYYLNQTAEDFESIEHSIGYKF